METEQSLPAVALPLPVVVRRGSDLRSSEQGTWLGRRGRLAMLAGLVVLALAAILFSLVTRGAASGSGASEPAVSPPPSVVALGRLVPMGQLRTLAAPFGAGDARVAQVLVSEGQMVQVGTPLVTFDNANALNASMLVATEQLAYRQAALAQAERSVASNQAESAAAVARAEVAAQTAEAEYQRWAALVDRGFVSPAAIDQRRAQRDEAAQELRRTRAVAARHAGEGTAQPELRAARVAVAVAAAERDRALQDLTKSVLHAPEDGTVIAIHTQPGERPGTAGVLDFGDTRTMTAELELYEGDAARVRVGQGVRLRSSALPGDLLGQVTRIGMLVGRQQRIDTSPAANLDARVVKATVVLDAPSSLRARSLLGLEVRAQIATESR
jgi:HlyD family secretion protein